MTLHPTWRGPWIVIAVIAATACVDYDYGENKRECDAIGGEMKRGCGEQTSHCSKTAQPYAPSSSPWEPPGACVSTSECGTRERCHGGTCMTDPDACEGDVDCPIGSECRDRTCRCTLDLACGAGLTCTGYSCAVCFGESVCRAPSCEADGGCPTPLRCDRNRLECVFGDRILCGEDAGACPFLMRCGSDGYCERGSAAVTDAGDGGDGGDGDDAEAPVDAALD